MSRDPQPAIALEPSGPDELGAWRLDLLRLALVWTGGALIVAALLMALMLNGHGRVAAPLFGLGLGLLCLYPLAPRAPQRTSVIYLIGAFGAVAWGVFVASWPPSVAAGLAAVLVLARLLLGRRAMVIVLLLSGLLFVVGGVAAQSGFFPELLHENDPKLPSSWLRSGALFLLVSVAAALIVRRAVVMLEAHERSVAAVIAAHRHEIALEADARRSRRSAESSLRRAQKLSAIAQLGRGFAHVFNNVLTVIRSAVDEARSAETEDAREAALGFVRSAAQASVDRTRSMLSLARADERPDEKADQSVAIDGALAAALPTLQKQLRSNIQLRFEPGVGARRARIGGPALDQILLNLALNAQQAMAGGGVIEVTTQRRILHKPHTASLDVLEPGEYVELRVSDSGTGMIGATAARAFEPFFTTRGMDQHDGLGLAIVHGYVRRGGGSVELLRTAGGVTIAIYFPVVGAGASSSGGKHGAARSAQIATADLQAVADRAASPPWKGAAIRRIIRASALIVVVLTAAAGFLIRDDGMRASNFIVGGGATAVLTWVGWFRPAWGARQLARLYSCLSMLAGASVIVAKSHLSPTAAIAMANAIIIAGIFLGRRAVVVAAVAAALVFVLGGWIHVEGLAVAPMVDLSATLPGNWARLAIVVPGMAFLAALGVSYLPAVVRARIAEMTTVEARLRQTRARRAEAGRATVDLGLMRQRAERMETSGRLTATVAHDINNSLQAIVLAEELIAECSGDSALVDDLLSEITAATDHIEALVNQLNLGVSTAAPPRGPIDVAAEVSQMAHMFRALLADRATLVLDVGQIPALAHVDVHRLRQALLNLVANARDAIGARDGAGRCGVRVCAIDQHVIVEVEDDGVGMTEALRARIFESFYTTKEGGTGLGLSSVAAIATEAEGDLLIASAPGEGSVFTLRLARVVGRATASSPQTRPVGRVGGQRVLLVDDDPQVRTMLRRGLVRAGYGVVEAEDGDAARREILSGSALDALCTDAVMPGLPLGEVLRLFHECYPGRPAIVISGYMPDEIRAGLPPGGAVEILQKPFTGKKLARVLAERLGQS